MNRRRVGLTIVEVLVALAFIGIVFSALASIQISSLRVTRTASLDSLLLQDAVTEFEKTRTVVLRHFREFYGGCFNRGDCPSGISDHAVVRRAVFQLEDDDDWVIEGLLEISVTVELDGRSLSFNQYVSCLDGQFDDSPPTIADVSSCKE